MSRVLILFPPVEHLCPVHDLLGLAEDGHGVDVQVELVGGEAPANIILKRNQTDEKTMRKLMASSSV